MRSRHLGAALLALLVSFAATAHAQSIIRRPYGGQRPLTVDIHGVAAWWGYGFGAGFRVDIPIVDNGFIPSINNSVYISVGADIIHFTRHGYLYTGFLPQVAMQWNFYLTRKWSVFGEPGFALHIPFNGHHHVAPWPVLFAGARYHFTERVALILRATWYGVHVGVVF